MSRPNPLTYYAKGKQVFLSHAEQPNPSKEICTATSNRLAQKIAANMNLMETRKQKAHEIYMAGESRPSEPGGRGKEPK